MFQQLETFCAVAESGSLNRAAEKLNRTQPAVTRQIRALERALGAVLLVRTPRGVTLTPVGEAVLVYARSAVTAVRACHQAAADLSAERARRLRVAAGLMATLYVLPPVVARFREAHPEVEVELRPTHQRLAMESLLRYEVDAAVLASPSGRSRVRSTAILRDPLLLVGAPGAARPPTTLAGLADLTLLVLPAGTGLHDQVVGAVRRRAPTCRLVEYPTAETIKASVGVGVGVTILPRSAVAGELAAGTLDGQPIEDWPGATRVIRLLVRAEGRVPPQVSAFGELLREHYRAAVSSRPRKTAPRTSA